jgi:nucleoside-triphosphatase
VANLKRIFLLTGSPGIGKTTMLLKIVEALKAKGCSVGGMVSREVRDGGTRVGFEILNLKTKERGWLAHVNQKTGPQVGKYRVNLEDLNNVGVGAIISAVKDCDVVAIDEIGPMELFSEKFKQAVKDAVESCTRNRGYPLKTQTRNRSYPLEGEGQAYRHGKSKRRRGSIYRHL